jgi:hypothetical protein
MISLSVNIAKGISLGAQIASPRERRTDSACASQDGAAEATSELSEGRSSLERLMAEPGPLERLTRSDG